MSDRPGEPCETSMPRIIVGVSIINGICGECSIASREFIPPSYVKARQHQYHPWDTNTKILLASFSNKYLRIDLKENICKILVVNLSWGHALCNNTKITETSLLPRSFKMRGNTTWLNNLNELALTNDSGC